MKITLLCVGKTNSRDIENLLIDYEKRLQHYIKFEVSVIELPSKMRRKSEDEQKQAEGELILSKLNLQAPLILLDERGKGMKSEDFARFLQIEMNRGPKEIYFCIGGAFGFSDAVYQKAYKKVSLSNMTFTHQMVRLFFTEQLYRAFTILKGEKYHH